MPQGDLYMPAERLLLQFSPLPTHSWFILDCRLSSSTLCCILLLFGSLGDVLHYYASLKNSVKKHNCIYFVLQFNLAEKKERGEREQTLIVSFTFNYIRRVSLSFFHLHAQWATVGQRGRTRARDNSEETRQRRRAATKLPQ